MGMKTQEDYQPRLWQRRWRTWAEMLTADSLRILTHMGTKIDRHKEVDRRPQLPLQTCLPYKTFLPTKTHKWAKPMRGQSQRLSSPWQKRLQQHEPQRSSRPSSCRWTDSHTHRRQPKNKQSHNKQNSHERPLQQQQQQHNKQTTKNNKQTTTTTIAECALWS